MPLGGEGLYPTEWLPELWRWWLLTGSFLHPAELWWRGIWHEDTLSQYSSQVSPCWFCENITWESRVPSRETVKFLTVPFRRTAFLSYVVKGFSSRIPQCGYEELYLQPRLIATASISAIIFLSSVSVCAAQHRGSHLCARKITGSEVSRSIICPAALLWEKAAAECSGLDCPSTQ